MSGIVADDSTAVVQEFREKHPTSPARESFRPRELHVDDTTGTCSVCGYWGVVPADSDVLDALAPSTDRSLVCLACAEELGVA